MHRSCCIFEPSGERVAIKAAHLEAINKLFRSRAVALCSDLCKALKVQSRVTVFRVLKAIGYHSSFSHAGRYYTLERIPEFDERGLWHYRDIGFSRHGTLRSTLVYLVDRSTAGYTHEELEAILKLRVHDTLLFLVKAGQLRREAFEDTYVYFSADRTRAAQQAADRQKLTPPQEERAAPPLPGSLAPAVVIDLLLDVMRHPEHDVKAVCRQLASQGHWITPAQVEEVFRRYDLKKTLRSRWPRSRR
jgi:hypothetical protein